MSERELRKAIEDYLGAPTAEGCLYAEKDIEQALADEPDVVKVLLHAAKELGKCEAAIAEATEPGGWVLAYVQEAAVWTGLIKWLRKKFHVRLTDEGWEWTE